jgi:cytochrome P450
MWTIYEMIGLPEELREEAAHHADGMVSWADPDVAAGREPGEVLNDSLVGLITIAFEMVQQRHAEPRDDLMTNLVQAEIDGQRLTDEEIASFFVLLSVAGNDTTRNSTTLGMKALCDFPDQRKLLADDVPGLIAPAVEDLMRLATPVMTLGRHALLLGQPRRARVRQPQLPRRHPYAEPACRLRWRRPALLPGQHARAHPAAFAVR